MADRQDVSIVAQDQETGVTVYERNGEYLVDDGSESYGPYSDKRKAAEKAKELQNSNGGSTEEKSGRLQQAATKFTKGVNKRVKGATSSSSKSESDGASKPQQYATAFADKVNESVSGAGGGSAQNGGSATKISVEYASDEGEWLVVDEGTQTADFYQTKAEAVNAANELLDSKSENAWLQVKTKEGEFQPSKSKEVPKDKQQGQQQSGFGGLFGGGQTDTDSGPSLAFMGGESEDSGSPSLAFMGGNSESDDPSLAFMGGSGGDAEMPMFGGGDAEVEFPGFGGGGDGDVGLPGMGDGPKMGGLPFGESDEDKDTKNPMDWF